MWLVVESPCLLIDYLLVLSSPCCLSPGIMVPVFWTTILLLNRTGQRSRGGSRSALARSRQRDSTPHTIQETSCTNEKSQLVPSNTRSMPAWNVRMTHRRAYRSPFCLVSLASVVTALLVSALTGLARPGLLQCLTPLSHQEVHQRKSRQGIRPPPAERPVEQKTSQ